MVFILRKRWENLRFNMPFASPPHDQGPGASREYFFCTPPPSPHAQPSFVELPLLFFRAFCFSIIILFGYSEVNFIPSQFLITDSLHFVKFKRLSKFDSFGFEMLMETFFSSPFFFGRKKPQGKKNSACF